MRDSKQAKLNEAMDFVYGISRFHYLAMNTVGVRHLNFKFPGTDKMGWGRLCYNVLKHRLYIDMTDRALEYDVPTIAFILMHEVEHVLRSHVPCAYNRNPIKWNIAGDILINQDLLDNEFQLHTVEIENEVYKRKQFKVPLHLQTTEEVYDYIPDDSGVVIATKGAEAPCSGGDIHKEGEGKEKKEGEGECSGEGDGEGDGEGEVDRDATSEDGDTYNITEDDIPHHIVEGAREKMIDNIKKGRGLSSSSVPNRFKDLFEEKQPKVDWRAILMDAFSEICPELEVTWSRINRRKYAFGQSRSIDCINPGHRIPRRPNVFVGIDTSGSCGGAIPYFLAEVNNILRSKDLEIDACFIDTSMYLVERVKQIDDLKEKVTGGGGTEFTPMYNHLTEGEKRYDLVIIMTDCYVNAPPKPLGDRTIVLNIGQPVEWDFCEHYLVDIDR